MFRALKSVGLAVLCAAGAAVAVPSGIASAIPFGLVKIEYRGEPMDLVPGSLDWGVEGEVGSTVLLNGFAEYEDPSFQWDIEPSWSTEGPYSVSAPTVELKCEQEGTISVLLWGNGAEGGEDYDSATVHCNRKHINRLDLGAPADPVRQVIPVGTTVTFEANPLRPDVPNVWRVTGQSAPVETRRFTHTFNQSGNIDVEVSSVTAAGMVQTSVGYTVVGPPSASITPSPAGRLRVALGSTVTFDGSGSTGGSLRYQWRTSGVPGVAGSQSTFRRRFDKLGNVGVELIVTNASGQWAKARVEVTVFKPAAPVVSVKPAPANPKDRMKVKLGSTVTFDGRASRDPDGGVLTYQWRTSGVRGLAGAASTYDRKFDKVGNYGVELTVIDDEGQRAKRWVGITVE